RAPSATARMASGPTSPGIRPPPGTGSSHAHLDVAEPGRGRGVTDPGDLSWLALATVRRPPQLAGLGAAHRVARAPEPGGHPGVGGVAVHLRQAAVLDAPRDLAPELEVHPLVVDRPRLVRGQVQAVLRVPDEVVERPFARLQADVRHADQREVLPAVGPHG